MQLNGYPLRATNKTVKNISENYNSEHKGKDLQPVKMFISYDKGVAGKLKSVSSKYGFTTVITKTKDLITNKTKR